MSLFELSVYCIWVNICLCECLFASCVLPLSASCLHQCEQCEHASDKLARVWLCVYVSCLPSIYKRVCGVSEQECYLQLGWPLWALQSSRPGRCYCGPQPWSDIWCLAWGSGWWPASPLDDWYSRLAPWWGGWGWVARRQVTEQLIILTLNYPEGFV